MLIDFKHPFHSLWPPHVLSSSFRPPFLTLSLSWPRVTLQNLPQYKGENQA